MAANGKVMHSGGCHCGAVRFQVLAPAQLDVIHCNCSICIKKQNHHFIVPQADFTLLKGEEFLTCYTFNTHQAKHTFCRICGVQSFYTPRSNPDGRGIAPHCLDEGTAQTVNVTSFDGSNWEKSFNKDPSIRDRSKT